MSQDEKIMREKKAELEKKKSVWKENLKTISNLDKYYETKCDENRIRKESLNLFTNSFSKTRLWYKGVSIVSLAIPILLIFGITSLFYFLFKSSNNTDLNQIWDSIFGFSP